MKVIIINGPMGVGKTTVGKYIAEQYPGTAFIDGDWCMDIHPFVGNRETKAMAVDNILHMVGKVLLERLHARRLEVVELEMDDGVRLPLPVGLVDVKALEEFTPPEEKRLERRYGQRLPEPSRTRNEEKPGVPIRDKAMHEHRLVNVYLPVPPYGRKIMRICRQRPHAGKIISFSTTRRNLGGELFA